MPSRLLKMLFFGILVRPIVLLLLGLHIVNRKALPLNGPAVIAANHNSHLDTLVLMSLFPLSMIHQVRPVAAADYFLRNRALAWFSLNIIGIIPLQRQGSRNMDKVFAQCHQALDQGEILLDCLEALFVPFNCDVVIGEPLPPLNFQRNLLSNWQQSTANWRSTA